MPTTTIIPSPDAPQEDGRVIRDQLHRTIFEPEEYLAMATNLANVVAENQAKLTVVQPVAAVVQVKVDAAAAAAEAAQEP